MKLFLKILLVIASIIGVLIVGVGIAMSFIDPNRFKPQISDAIQKITHRELKINGNISWAIIDGLGIKMEKLTLSNLSGSSKNTFISIDSIHFGLGILELLYGKVDIENITIHGMQLNLVQDQNGKKNWQDLQNNLTNQLSDSNADSGKSNFSFSVRHIYIKNSEINFTNASDTYHIAIEKFRMRNGARSGEPVNMNVSMRISSRKNVILALNDTDIIYYSDKQILEIPALNGDMFSGDLQGKMTIDLSGDSPRTNIEADLTNVQLGSILSTMNIRSKVILTGTGEMHLKLSTVGNSGSAWIRNLNGTASAHFENGKMVGINIPYLTFSAFAFVKHMAVPAEKSNETPYDSLSANVVFQNGVMSNNDLAFISTGLNVKGKGRVNFVNHTINYHLIASIKSAEEGNHLFTNLFGSNTNNSVQNLYSVNVPITISGNLSSPKINVDMKNFLLQVPASILGGAVNGVGKILTPVAAPFDFLKNIFP